MKIYFFWVFMMVAMVVLGTININTYNNRHETLRYTECLDRNHSPDECAP